MWDVVVVGAGPAGSSAARAAALTGAHTLILDRATFPRYKTCGGGLIGVTLANLPPDIDLPVQQQITRFSSTLRGGRERDWATPTPYLALVNRDSFDLALLESAERAGATVRTGVTVTGISEDSAAVRLRTSAGVIDAALVIGADGSASRIARHVGATMAQTDLGLEVELAPSPSTVDAWAGRVHLDWGAAPGSYAWVFPKSQSLTVGVIQAKGAPAQTRQYLADFVAAQGLSSLRELRSTGHLTRCRTATSPVSTARVLLAGDAAGLLEPWTREGISYAVRSGALAGSLALHARPGTEYQRCIAEGLACEMAAGSLMLAAFAKHSGLVHTAINRTPLGRNAFLRLTRGETTLARILDRRGVAPVVRRLAR